MAYALAFPKHTQRPNFYDGGAPQTQFLPDLRLGRFETKAQAKRAYLVSMQELSQTQTYTEKFISLHFAVHQRGGLVKIVEIQDKEPTQ